MNAYKERVELNLHTTVSACTSVITPRNAIERAVALGHRAVAITDLYSVQNFFNAAWCAEKHRGDIKVIYGTEIAMEVPVIILAKNKAGIKALYKILSYVEENFTICEKILRQYHENLIYGLPQNRSTFDYADMDYEPEDQLRQLSDIYDFVALYPTDEEELNKRMYACAKELGIPVVAAGECCYMDPEDQVCVEVINNLKYKRGWRQASAHFRTTEEMLKAFSYLGEAVAWEIVVNNPNRIADMVEDFNPTEGIFPEVSIPGAYKTVSQLCDEKLAALYGDTLPEEIKTRMEEEFSLLGNNATMYLICHHIAKYIQQNGKLSGFRGGVGSTMIGYLLGISDVNPLPAHYRCPHCKHIQWQQAESGFDLPKKNCPNCGQPMVGDGHNIPYESGLLYYGGKVDIDINVPKHFQRAAIRFLAEFWGEDRVAHAGTVETYQQWLADAYVKTYFDLNQHRKQADWQKVAKKVSDIKKNEGRHPGGIMLLPEGMEWEDVTPLSSVDNKDGVLPKVTHLEYYQLEDFLPKVDILGYRVLDQLGELFERTGVTPNDIDYSDPQVYQLFKNLETDGIPEFNTEFTKGLLAHLEDIGFDDLVRISGMAHGTNVWLDNAENLIHTHPFKELIATREDVYLTLRKHGIDPKTAFAIMTDTRKGKLGWKERLGLETERHRTWMALMEEAGVPDWYIQSMKQIHYLFPKAHATHYTKLAVMAAWFKVYYPTTFAEVMIHSERA